MFLATTSYKAALEYWSGGNIFGAFENVTVEYPNSAESSIYPREVYYVEVNREDAFANRLSGQYGIGREPFEALQDLYKTKYVFYKDDVHIHKIKESI